MNLSGAWPTREDELTDRVVFRGRQCAVGRFRCPAWDARFGPWEQIEGFCLVFPRTSVLIEHEGVEPVVADPNQVMLYNDGQVYRRSLISERGDLCEWFGVAPELLIEAISEHDPSVVERPTRPLSWLKAPSSREAYALQRVLYRHACSCDPVDEMLVTEGVMTLVGDAVSMGVRRRRRVRERTVDDGVRRSEDVARVINRRYFEPISLDDIASSVGLSVYHLCRVFQRATGSTIHRYLTCVRLRTSLEHLDTGASDLTRVALALGFSSHSHFTDSFRREFGITPSRFRRPTSHEDASLARDLMEAVRSRGGWAG